MKRWVSLRWASIVLAMVLGCVMLTQMACPRREQQRVYRSVVRKLDQEPRLTVFVKETNEKKEMAMEEYITGVVAGEMRKGWPEDAYAAQAIVARTFTMDFLARGGTRRLHGTDVSTDEQEAQAYNAEAITPEIRRAVQKTKGKVMTYRGRFVRGWFSASCGGRTALAREGLAFREAEPPYMSSVSCRERKVIPEDEFFWEAGFSRTEIANAMRELGKDVGPVQRVEIAQKSRTGRAVRIRVIGQERRAEVAGGDLRMALDPQKIRSIWINSIENTDAGIRMRGQGFGHGVGLCQWGAYAMAKDGHTPVSIVKHYYPKVRIMDIW